MTKLVLLFNLLTFFWALKGPLGIAGHKKTGTEAGLSGFPGLVGASGNWCMVPRGRLELPLLSETDFESAASTGSATGAMAAEYRDGRRSGQSKVRW